MQDTDTPRDGKEGAGFLAFESHALVSLWDSDTKCIKGGEE